MFLEIIKIPSSLSRKEAKLESRRLGSELASKLLEKLGIKGFPVLRDLDGAPIWPSGITGSISNFRKADGSLVIATAVSSNLLSLGIDIEDRTRDAFKSAKVFLSKSETELFDKKLDFLVAFSAKEALYKAVYPLIKTSFWFFDVQIIEFSKEKLVLEPKEKLKKLGVLDSIEVKYKILEDLVLTTTELESQLPRL